MKAVLPHLVLVWSLCIGLIIFLLAMRWKCFVKAGIEGWQSLIPILAEIRTFQMAKMSPVLVILMFIPCANIVISFILMAKLCDSFSIKGFAKIISILIPYVGYAVIALNGLVEYNFED